MKYRYVLERIWGALKITTGEPWHPLYIGYDAAPFEIPVATM